MRRVLALLVAAAVIGAEDEQELARRVEELVRELGAPTADARTMAQFQLAAYGDKVRPLLERVVSDDPEVNRSIRYLLRSAGKVQLELLPPPDGPLAIGAPLVLEVWIINNTDQLHQLLPDAGRQGATGPFRIRVGGKTPVPVGFDQVNWGEGTCVIIPGGTRRFRLTLDGDSSPLRRPALYDVSVIFDGTVAFGYGTIEDDAVETFRLVRESAPVKIHVLGRKADDLDRALRSESAREREAAAKELALRDDEAIVPILRQHAQEGPLRLAAVRRLAALGAAEDFDLIFKATEDLDAAVRRAGVAGLAKYASAKVRNRLLKMASDHELQAEVIQALRGHKHVATVECLVKLLASQQCVPETNRQIRLILLGWTGLAVDDRPSEIRAFRAWWEVNRARWAEENSSGK